MNKSLRVICWPLCFGVMMYSNTWIEQPEARNAAAAFPGAEGFGRYATGGRGGKVMIVTNLNNDGAGSLRAALKGNNSKIVVFGISGTIHLQSKLNLTANTTIAGQTAPGDGICIADYPVSLSGNNIIVRFLRFRMGDKNQKSGMTDGSGSDDALGGQKRNNIIIDHCSISWSTDEVLSVYQGDSTTLQWNIISEPLNYSYHFETGDKDYEHHGFGGIWGGRHLSAHHNLFAHCASRTPRFDGNRNQAGEFVDFRNNVIYNWSHNNVYAGEGGTYNIINNYYKPGPDTKSAVRSRIANPYKSQTLPYGKWYVDGNFVEDAPSVSANNWLGVVMDKGNVADASKAKLIKPVSTDSVTTQSAPSAYASVLENAGACYPGRDTLDQRIISDTRNGKGHLIDVQGGFPHGTPYELSSKAWPYLRNQPAKKDTDKDGMPDEWEQKNKLDINNPRDASNKSQASGYTNIELYINGLLPQSTNSTSPIITDTLIKPDTSFNINDTYLKERKSRPYIQVADPPAGAGIRIKQDIVYSSIGNRKLKADIIYPAGDNPGTKPIPAIVMIFGGGWKSGNKSQNLPIGRQLAAKGYVALTIEYRLSGEAKYPAAVQDVKTAIRWLRANAKRFNIDTTKIVTLGMSAGGQLAALAGTTNGDKHYEGVGGNTSYSSNVQAIVNIDGLLAFHHPESAEGKSAAEFLDGSYEENPGNWEEASALHHTDKNTPPILFINSSLPRFHAGRDDMIRKLDSLGIYHEMHTFPDSPHPFWFFHPWFEPTVNFILAFLEKIFPKH